MPDINDYIMHPENDNKSPEVVDRELALKDWDKNVAQRLSDEEGIVLTPEHWQVINYLQEYYLRNGWPDKVHTLSKNLDAAFSGSGGSRYLYQLFPNGPLAQGCRIAGLPVPPQAENKSFGSAQ